jgi:hypothetical protein
MGPRPSAALDGCAIVSGGYDSRGEASSGVGPIESRKIFHNLQRIDPGYGTNVAGCFEAYGFAVIPGVVSGLPQLQGICAAVSEEGDVGVRSRMWLAEPWCQDLAVYLRRHPAVAKIVPPTWGRRAMHAVRKIAAQELVGFAAPGSEHTGQGACLEQRRVRLVYQGRYAVCTAAAESSRVTRGASCASGRLRARDGGAPRRARLSPVRAVGWHAGIRASQSVWGDYCGGEPGRHIGDAAIAIARFLEGEDSFTTAGAAFCVWAAYTAVGVGLGWCAVISAEGVVTAYRPRSYRDCFAKHLVTRSSGKIARS